jgi:hypothetical protein
MCSECCWSISSAGSFEDARAVSLQLLFSGQAVRSEMVVLMLEKWGLHPELREKSEHADLNNLERDADVFIPAEEYERAREILFGESEIERAGF